MNSGECDVDDEISEGMAESKASDQLERSPLLSYSDNRGGSVVNFLTCGLLPKTVFELVVLAKLGLSFSGVGGGWGLGRLGPEGDLESDTTIVRSVGS